MCSSAWIFFFAVAGFVDATTRKSMDQRIIEFENEICEPFKRHLDVQGCALCICRDHGYGSVCEYSRCQRSYSRPIGVRECTPYSHFETGCHFCECSSTGVPIKCIEKMKSCMQRIVRYLEDEKHGGSPNIVERFDEDAIF